VTFRYELAQQGRGNEGVVLGLVATAAANPAFDRIRASYAYASSGGAVELTRALSSAMRQWDSSTKQWLISFDWGHTDPAALRLLAALPNSEVRIPFAEEVLGANLRPRTCFHPKTALFDIRLQPASHPLAVAMGSANMTVSGLRTGHEDLSVAIWTGGRLGRVEQLLLDGMAAERRRLDDVWRRASRLTPSLLTRYEALRPGRRFQTEDASGRARQVEQGLTLTFERAAQLQAARSLWVRIDYVVANLGAGRPGNQIDLARGSRVFFGFTPEPVPRNSLFGAVEISIGTGSAVRNMRFGNNQMDKLDLPLPGAPNPAAYNNRALRFDRTAPGKFRLRVGSPAEAAQWKARSDARGTTFTMNSGRQWGVF